MRLLDAVNSILPKLGEHPVTSLDTKHPTLAILLPLVEQEVRALLLPGLWFNTHEDVVLYPDSEKGIVIPNRTLSFIPEFGTEATVRGDRLYNLKTRNYLWDRPVRGRWVEDVPFEELPESAAYYVMYSACIIAYSTDIGVEQELQVWQTQAMRAHQDLYREHLRNMKYTTQRSYRYRRYRNALRG